MNAQSRNRRSTVKSIAITMTSLVIVVALTDPVLAQSSAKAAKELSSVFSAASKTAMPAVVSIKVEKAVEAGPMTFGTPFGYNDPFGLFDDDLLRKFFGDRLPPQQQQQQAPQKYYERGQGSGFIMSKDGCILTH